MTSHTLFLCANGKLQIGSELKKLMNSGWPYYNTLVVFVFDYLTANHMGLWFYLGGDFLLVFRFTLYIFRAPRIRQLLQPQLTAPLSPWRGHLVPVLVFDSVHSWLKSSYEMEHTGKISGEVPGKQMKNKHTKTHQLNWKIISLGWLSKLPPQPVAKRRCPLQFIICLLWEGK